MPYTGSYIWKIRQKIGHDALIIPSADAVAVSDDGKLLLVFNKDWNNWFFPGGYAEEGQNSAECAMRELLEEAGIRSESEDLIPFAFASGHKAIYTSGDVTFPFTQIFIAQKWQDLGDDLDATEVSDRKWFSIDELKKLNISSYTRRIIDAYEEYAKTRRYQMINLRGEQ